LAKIKFGSGKWRQPIRPDQGRPARRKCGGHPNLGGVLSGKIEAGVKEKGA
jgi:hypothetical protein